uniref:Putative iron binding protein involved in fe-s cluster formation n=1 Tax=Amblyomma triste TaxID=251400 RepID=A0A023GH87_AMBTT
MMLLRTLHRSLSPARKTLAVVPSSSYHEKVIDHYENPRNVGSLNKDDKNVGTGLVGAPACGDVMKLQVTEAMKIKNTDIAKELSLPPVKLHCSMLAEDAIKAALNDYKRKRGEPEAPKGNADASTSSNG